jgi:hypothetical protein
MLTQNLRNLYLSHLDELRNFSISLDDNDDCDGPFLMNEPSLEFKQSKHKLLIVGQETNGWLGGFSGDSEADLDHNRHVYEQFNFGENYRNLFFPYARTIATRLTGHNVWMWSNLFKFGKASGRGYPSDKINELELNYFNVFREEIRILNPTCVVFMTGPNYDSTLQQRIPDASFAPLENFSLRQLAKVASTLLPKTSYRIYHPGYGNRHTEIYQLTLAAIEADYPRFAGASTQS